MIYITNHHQYPLGRGRPGQDLSNVQFLLPAKPFSILELGTSRSRSVFTVFYFGTQKYRQTATSTLHPVFIFRVGHTQMSTLDPSNRLLMLTCLLTI